MMAIDTADTDTNRGEVNCASNQETTFSATCSEHGNMEQDNQSTNSTTFTIPDTIPLFYKNTSVFITGATGFLGKSILEKLLRSCPDIDKIFVLVRTKKGHSPSERVEALFNSKLFDRAQLERGSEECKSKVVAIAGDVLEERLGISEEDEQMLISSNISTVIHSAATIRFDEPLRFALTLNVGGTLKVVNLCKKLSSSLKALVHVSTAYANCDMPFIEEQVYPPPVDPHKLLDAITWMSDEAAAKITPVLIGDKPNTYTYTKHLAENLLIQEAGDTLPYIIVRPSIVGASWKEPFPGWIDNFNGPSGLFIACGMGLLRSMIGNPDAIADIVPVDIVSNVIIAAPWYRACAMLSNTRALEATTECRSKLSTLDQTTPSSLSYITKPKATNLSNSYKANLQNEPLNIRTGPPQQSNTSLHAMVSSEQVTSPERITSSGRVASPERITSSEPVTSSDDELIGRSELERDSLELVPPTQFDAMPSSLSSRRGSNHSWSARGEGEIETEAEEGGANEEPIVINCCSGYSDQSITWGVLPVCVSNSYVRTPFQGAIRYPNCKITGNRLMYFLWMFTCHRIPAFLIDTYMRIIGKKPRMMSMYRKLHRSMDTLSFFTQRHWEWEVKSLRHMQQLILHQHSASTTSASASASGGSEWNTSVKDIDWADYLETFCVGTKCFVLNEEMSDLHLAKQRMSRLKTLHYLFNIFTAAMVWRIITLKSEVACKLSNMFVRVFFKWLESMRLSRFVTL